MMDWPTPAWPTTLAEAEAIQQQLRPLVQSSDSFGPLHLIAGIDASYTHDEALAGVVIFRYPELSVVEYRVARAAVTLPYIPGFLSFREGPAIMAALAQISHQPDLLIFDGQGIAHPRRLGIAAHIGVLTNLPAIGCAKSILIGRHDPLELQRGATAELWDQDEVIGMAVRTRSNVKPVYVSVGHRISLASAVQIVLDCAIGFRLPEPTRAADGLVSHGRIPLLDQRTGDTDVIS